MEIRKTAILGGGLLGGSLALRLKGMAAYALWARRAEAVAEAKQMGVEHATSDLAEAIDGADLVVLTVPVGVMPGLVKAALEAGLPRAALVTDVGSVKRSVHQQLGQWLGGEGVAFIGGHPMAGSEARGIGAAQADLFEGAACMLTDDEAVGQPWTGKLEDFWKAVGCRVSWTDAVSHDALVARISHFPHVTAAATAMVALEQPEDARFGGGGLRDTTRVAGGDPSMWAEILMENRDAVAKSLSDARDSLGEVLAMLERGDHEAVRVWLAEAQRRHRTGKAAKDRGE